VLATDLAIVDQVAGGTTVVIDDQELQVRLTKA